MFVSAFVTLLVICGRFSHTTSLENCGTYSFCWMFNSNTTYDGIDINLWLNGVELISIGIKGKVMSLKLVSSSFHSLTFQNGRDVFKWRISTSSCSSPVVVRSDHEVKDHPINSTLEALKSLNSGLVFACENRTLYLRQEADLIFAVGYTERFPLTVESRSISSLLISWNGPYSLPGDQEHKVTLYEPDDDSVNLVTVDSVLTSYYRFNNLDSCKDYVACVEMADNPSIVCVKALTDPDVPRDFRVTALNGSSIAVSWDCPLNQEYTLFTVSVLHLNSTGQLILEESYRHEQDELKFTVRNLPVCSKVQLALQTVCESDETRSSEKIFIDGNAANVELKDVRQAAATNVSYTLTWFVRNDSSISMFRVYNDDVLQNITTDTNYTVTGLQPCHQYNAKVEAVCGEDVVMSVMSIQATTGPGTVSQLQIQIQDSKVYWTTKSGSTATFVYELYDENWTVVEGGKLSSPVLEISDLKPRTHYQLELTEECFGEHGSSVFLEFVTEARLSPAYDFPNKTQMDPPGSLEGSTVQSLAQNVTVTQAPMRTMIRPSEDTNIQFALSYLFLIVPWALPPYLKNLTSKARIELNLLVKNKLEDIFKEYPGRVKAVLVAFESAKYKTKITFKIYDVSKKEIEVLLSPAQLTNYIQSHTYPNLTFSNGGISLDDQDECSSVVLNDCSKNSYCINTLDSYTCVCHEGYYDVSDAISPRRSTCDEDGMFTQCTVGQIKTGISKQFLRSRFGGEVNVVLNDGSCRVKESEKYYYSSILSNHVYCGARILGSI
ncbi:uncharacterized protein LOC136771455 [Amia ocellicauda]|uniref:uncharacterized protein LOC136771455 n=1 Tax=Amia ocellicauda TaxID=2972642 RepID=UPI0034646CAC